MKFVVNEVWHADIVGFGVKEMSREWELLMQVLRFSFLWNHLLCTFILEKMICLPRNVEFVPAACICVSLLGASGPRWPALKISSSDWCLLPHLTYTKADSLSRKWNVIFLFSTFSFSFPSLFIHFCWLHFLLFSLSPCLCHLCMYVYVFTCFHLPTRLCLLFIYLI